MTTPPLAFNSSLGLDPDPGLFREGVPVVRGRLQRGPPRAMKRDVEDTHIYFPRKVLTEVRKMAHANRRTISAEIVLAVENKVQEWKTQGQGGVVNHKKQVRG